MLKTYPKIPELEFLILASQSSVKEFNQSSIIALLKRRLNWELIWQLSCYHRISALVYQSLIQIINKTDVIPQEILERFKNYYYQSLLRSLKQWQVFSKIKERFAQNNIECLPLKGIILGTLLYENPALRPMLADIDILVKKNDFDRACLSLEDMGFCAIKKEDHVTAYRKEGTVVELHHNILPDWASRLDINLFWQNAVYKLVAESNIRVLSWEDMFLALSLQLRHEWHSFFLTRVLDLHELATSKKNEMDWDYITNCAQRCHLAGTVYFATFMCQKIFNSVFPKNFSKRLIISKLRRRILDIACAKEVSLLLKTYLGYTKTQKHNKVLKILLNDTLFDSLRIALHTSKLLNRAKK